MGRNRRHHKAAAASVSDDAVSLPSQEHPRWETTNRASSETGFPVSGLFHGRPHHRGGRHHRSKSHSRSQSEMVQGLASAEAAPLPSSTAVTVFKSPTDFPRSSAGRNELDVIANMPSYLDLSNRKPSFVPTVIPKSRLLVSDLDNTLFAPAATPTSSVQARPFLKTFIKYIMHPGSPYQFAVWTFSGRSFGEAHLRRLGLSKYLFAGDEPILPNEKGLVAAFWGYEDSRISGLEAAKRTGPAVKDLDWMWDMINARKDRASPVWSARNSLIVDDQATNAAAQPNSLIEAPVYTWQSPDDDFLLQLIGVLDELAYSTNFAATLKDERMRFGIDPADAGRYSKRGEDVCLRMGIKISRGRTAMDAVSRMTVAPVTTSRGPVHDDAANKTPPEPNSMEAHTPSRVAKGMTLAPSKLYLKEADEPSHIGKVKTPLVIFDLDGTLYTRPPNNLEHDPLGQPAGRPYLRSMLLWLLNCSPYHVAIWTGSQKATAVRCLDDLDLGIVGRKLVGPNKNQAELLHPKLVALWAREDFGLTDEDYHSYVAVVKDLDKMWDYLTSKKLVDTNWSPFNTAMVDDTPSKLRAQPDTLIAAPTFDYPLDPSPEASRAMLDTFLLGLVGRLDELSAESNFANYISSEHWNQVGGGRNAEFVSRGVRILKQFGIAVDAEGRGPVPLEASARRPDRPALVIPKTVFVLKSQSSAGPSPSTPSTAVSTPSGLDSPAEESPLPPSRRSRRAPLTDENLNLSDVSTDTDDTDTDQEKNRFVREVEAQQERRGRRRREKEQRRRSHQQRLHDAVEDWELMSDDPKAPMKEVPSPYYDSRRR